MEAALAVIVLTLVRLVIPIGLLLAVGTVVQRKLQQAS